MCVNWGGCFKKSTECTARAFCVTSADLLLQLCSRAFGSMPDSAPAAPSPPGGFLHGVLAKLLAVMLGVALGYFAASGDRHSASVFWGLAPSPSSSKAVTGTAVRGSMAASASSTGSGTTTGTGTATGTGTGTSTGTATGSGGGSPSSSLTPSPTTSFKLPAAGRLPPEKYCAARPGGCTNVQRHALEVQSDMGEVIFALTDGGAVNNAAFWVERMRIMKLDNYFILALDDAAFDWCKAQNARCLREDIPAALLTVLAGRNHREIISAAKYDFVADILDVGVHTLMTDTDIVYFDNPFCHFFRDSDVEAMSDGWSNATLYGGWVPIDQSWLGVPVAGVADIITADVWRLVYLNAGFVYARANARTIAAFRETARRLRTENLWDQAAMNHAMLLRKTDANDGGALRAGGFGLRVRVMDARRAANSKVVYLYKDTFFGNATCPAAIHINYHVDKIQKMQEVATSPSYFAHCIQTGDRSLCNRQRVPVVPMVT